MCLRIPDSKKRNNGRATQALGEKLNTPSLLARLESLRLAQHEGATRISDNCLWKDQRAKKDSPALTGRRAEWSSLIQFLRLNKSEGRLHLCQSHGICTWNPQTDLVLTKSPHLGAGIRNYPSSTTRSKDSADRQHAFAFCQDRFIYFLQGQGVLIAAVSCCKSPQCQVVIASSCLDHHQIRGAEFTYSFLLLSFTHQEVTCPRRNCCLATRRMRVYSRV